MANTILVLTNGDQTATFVPYGAGYRPEWFRLGERPMLRFKDHEWLNIGDRRIVEGTLRVHTDSVITCGGRHDFAGTPVEWSVSVSLPADGGRGFTVTTQMTPLYEPIEVLEALSTFELPYEYDGNEHRMAVICQQPVFAQEGKKEISGLGYTHPLWYYGRAGQAHLTYYSASPLLAHRISDPDGGNARCTMILGNWDFSTSHDIFLQPTRTSNESDIIYSDPTLRQAPGLRGVKFLVGALNWSRSLDKDPNWLIEAGVGLRQQVVVDFAPEPADGRWDSWLARGWERLATLHFPAEGLVPAYEVATACGASWTAAAEWLCAQFTNKDGYSGFFEPEHGPLIYAPGTRPKWGHGVPHFAGGFAGPVAYLGHLWADDEIKAAADRLEMLFTDWANPESAAVNVGTIGPTPMYVGLIRKAQVTGISAESKEKLLCYFTRRAERILNPAPGDQNGDAGILAWDAYAQLLAADTFSEASGAADAGRELLARVNPHLDADFWAFNCAAVGDAVGGGQARPFGHAMASAANMLAARRFGDPAYADAGARFANLLLGMHYITYNESQSPDLDSRGWAHGSTSGRDQWAQMPPWETGYSLQQLAYLLVAGQGRPGFYDVLWLFSHTGLAQFPAARTLKRLYKPDMSITYRSIQSLPTEREFYLRLPYLAYENPWDQTMLASYQGMEPLILSAFFGGGLVRAEDHRVLAVVPEAALFDIALPNAFTVELWNPLHEPITTRLELPIATRRGISLRLEGQEIDPACPWSAPLTVPPREVVRLKVTPGLAN